MEPVQYIRRVCGPTPSIDTDFACEKLCLRRYRRFVDGNVRLLDLQFIDLFSPDPNRHLECHLKVI
jgi:hypothetical protein